MRMYDARMSLRTTPRVLASRYELGSVLGSGGFATVYRGRDLESREDVAIKIIPAGGESGAETAERFRREALAVSQLRSPNVVRVFDFGKDDAFGLYLVMELIDGVALEPAKLGRVLLAHEVLRAARALLAGLAEAHASGIMHGDVKPANVLVPGGIAGLANLKVLDFGLARSERRAQLDAESGVLLTRDSHHTVGTPAYMAPELLLGEEGTPASDVYSVGLVLYELLGHNLLFPDGGTREQLALRTKTSPNLAGRVPSPLDEVLGRMLQRFPEKRFVDAGDALTTILNMETAPIDLDELAATMGTPIADVRRSAPPKGVTPSLRKSVLPSAYSAEQASEPTVYQLDEDPIAAFRATLHACDLPMLDALSRREREGDLGRAARALVLALRLELDAAAQLLEPLRARTALARGVGVFVVAPRARAATRARLLRGIADDDAWIDSIDVEVGQLLVSIEAALSGPVVMGRCLARVERMLARSHTPSPARTTLALAEIALSAAMRSTYAEGKQAWDALAASESSPADPSSPLVSMVRALVLALLAFRIDDHAARASFQYAANAAAHAGMTLLEARARCSLGGMLVEVPSLFERGRTSLERATALLLYGDAPSIEHVAAHNRGLSLAIERQFASAARQFRRAREVAAGEVPMESELLSGASEVETWLAAGDFDQARAVAKRLEVSRNVSVAPREALLVTIACSLVRLLDDGVAAARAELARAVSPPGARDTLLLLQALDLMFASMAGEKVDWLRQAGALHQMGEEHGYLPFYWFEAMRAFISRLPDETLREAGIHAVDRLIVLLGPPSKV